MCGSERAATPSGNWARTWPAKLRCSSPRAIHDPLFPFFFVSGWLALRASGRARFWKTRMGRRFPSAIHRFFHVAEGDAATYEDFGGIEGTCDRRCAEGYVVSGAGIGRIGGGGPFFLLAPAPGAGVGADQGSLVLPAKITIDSIFARRESGLSMSAGRCRKAQAIAAGRTVTVAVRALLFQGEEWGGRRTPFLYFNPIILSEERPNWGRWSQEGRSKAFKRVSPAGGRVQNPTGNREPSLAPKAQMA